MFFYQILTGLGVVLGLLSAFLAKSFTLGFIFVVVPGMLWFYSASYKRQFLVGNLIVALLSAISVFIVAVFQIAVLKNQYTDFLFETQIPATIYTWIGGFAFFAFLCTFLREIIKDMEDVEGDCEMECRTMPIKWGTGRTKIFVYFFILLIIILLLILNNMISFEGRLTFHYILFGLVIPFLALAVFIFIAKNKNDFHQSSALIKIIMLVGVLYSLFFYYLTAKQFSISLFGILMVK
jgi:4-hydroxybenzoate polyprenyltransferase